MNKNLIPQITIPLCPLVFDPKCKDYDKSYRSRPEQSLDLEAFIGKISPEVISKIKIGSNSWGVLYAKSPYSPSIHVMVMELSKNRILPGPEHIPIREGEHVMKLCSLLLDFTSKQNDVDAIHFGYNWSPRSWGWIEEKCGFQSIIGKWHPMIFGWPDFSNENSYIKWISPKSLSLNEQRIIGNNRYGKQFGLLIQHEIKEVLREHETIFDHKKYSVDGRGLIIPIKESLHSTFSRKQLFRHIIKPLAFKLDRLFSRLTTLLTIMDCEVVDNIIQKAEKGALSKGELKMLRARPKMNSYKKVKKEFKKYKLSMKLFEELYEAARKRCNEEGSPDGWWRKGFGYSVIFSGKVGSQTSELRIAPGVYVNHGGIVEALGVRIIRQENKYYSKNALQKKKVLVKRLKKYIERSLI